MKDESIYCDPETGECQPAALETKAPKPESEEGVELIYVGDPMCSWCWGISNHLQRLKEHYAQFPFRIVLGGLRPGGGEAWDERMKDFLRHHWAEVTKRSGQPFGYDLFDRKAFNYDTEPPCRAVITARMMGFERELDFFEAISRKFYVENEDPGEAEFYRSICQAYDLDFERFMEVFESEEARYRTYQNFQLNRQWGVTGYPTVIFKAKDQLYQVNYGYTEFEQMQEVIEKIRSEA